MPPLTILSSAEPFKRLSRMGYSRWPKMGASEMTVDKNPFPQEVPPERHNGSLARKTRRKQEVHLGSSTGGPPRKKVSVFDLLGSPPKGSTVAECMALLQEKLQTREPSQRQEPQKKLPKPGKHVYDPRSYIYPSLTRKGMHLGPKI